jgi:uncharacterized membrane protein YkgB
MTTTSTFLETRAADLPNRTRSWTDSVGQALPRYGLALVIGWVGLMKFTGYEAEAITGLVGNSPLLSWLYQLFSPRTVSTLFGLVEVSIAVLLVAGGRFPKAQLIGSAGAVAMFAITASFLLSTPGAFEPTLGGFPALSVLPVQFIVKDIALLAVAVYLLREGLKKWRAAA